MKLLFEPSLNKQDQGSTALPFYIFQNVPDLIWAVEETSLGFHYLESICMGYQCPNVNMFKISES